MTLDELLPAMRTVAKMAEQRDDAFAIGGSVLVERDVVERGGRTRLDAQIANLALSVRVAINDEVAKRGWKLAE